MRRVRHLSDLDNKWPSYGAMTAFNIGLTVVITAPNTWTAVPSSLSSGLLRNFTFQSASELVCGDSGVYKIDWNMAVEAVGANDNVEGGVTINGTIQTGFVSHLRFASPNFAGSFGAAGIVRLTAGDIIRLAVNNNTDADDVIVQHVALTAIMLQK